MEAKGKQIGFARWRSGSASGGNRYDEVIASELASMGVDLREYAVTGPWPLPAEDDRARLTGILGREREWLIGNILASAAPDEIEAVVRSGKRITVLVHYFPADDPGLSSEDRQRLATSEGRALRAASAVVTTSQWAAREVEARYGRDDADAAVPGAEPAPLAPGSATTGSPGLLWLGRLSQTKDPLTFIEALAQVKNTSWTAALVGPDSSDALASQVRARITELGLTGRVEMTGPLDGAELDRAWTDTDLLIHTSRAETYGMVVSEAAARGIPTLVATGTGAVEAQRVGANFPPGDPSALADQLRIWLTDADLRRQWRANALTARRAMPTWEDTAHAVLRALAP